jgi:hypothetical protein
MVSQAKQIANRLNAQHSTGPRTDEGKQRASRNRLTHGFYSARVVLPGEDADAYAELHAQLVAEHRPQTPTQQLCVDRIAACTWKLWRMERAQAQDFAENGAALRSIAAYQAELLGGETEERRAAQFRDAQRRAADEDPAAVLAASMARANGGAHDRYVRHEQRLLGMIHRALAELRRLRKDREVVDALPEPPTTPEQPTEQQDDGKPDERASERNEPTAARVAWSPSATTAPSDAPTCTSDAKKLRNEPTAPAPLTSRAAPD